MEERYRRGLLRRDAAVTTPDRNKNAIIGAQDGPNVKNDEAERKSGRVSWGKT